MESVSAIKRKTRLAAGWEETDGQWRKRCPHCEQLLPATREFFYFRANGSPQSRCKTCANKHTNRITRDTKRMLVAQVTDLQQRVKQLTQTAAASQKELNVLRHKDSLSEHRIAQLVKEIQRLGLGVKF